MLSVDIGGRAFVIDLWWQVREGGIASRKIMLALAKDVARKEKDEGREAFDSVVLRRHQFGLGLGDAECLEQTCQGLPALAAALRPAAFCFLGLFCFQEATEKTPGLWWICAIRQGTIVGDGDKVFTSFEHARTHYLHMLDLLGKCDVERTFATPAESMEAIIPMLRPEARVEELNPPPKKRKRLLYIGVVIALLLAAWAGRSFMEHTRLQQEQAALQELSVQRQAEKERLRAHPEQYFTQPTRTPLLAGCLTEILHLPLVVQGWLLKESTCEPDSLTLTYQHERGANYQVLPEHASLVDKAAAKSVLPRTPSSSSSTPFVRLLTKDEATRLLYQVTQDAGLILRLAWQPRESRDVDGVTLYAPWTLGQCEFTLPENLLLEPQFTTLLENIPGLNLTAIVAADQWVAKGVIYAR